jgi:hypothetical protein
MGLLFLLLLLFLLWLSFIWSINILCDAIVLIAVPYYFFLLLSFPPLLDPSQYGYGGWGGYYGGDYW